MSVVGVRILFDGRVGESEGLGKSMAVRTFRIQTNNAADDETDITNSGQLPKYLDPHPNNQDLLCRKVQYRQERGAFFWIGSFTYSSEPLPRVQRDIQDFPDPVERPVRISGDASQFTKIPLLWRPVLGLVDGNAVIDFDADPVPILNSAGDPYDSLPEIDDTRWAIHFSKNYAEIPDWVWDYNDGVNDGDTTLVQEREFTKRQLKLSHLRFSDLQEQNGIEFITVSWDVQYKETGWFYELPDRGFHFISSGQRKQITLSDGTLPAVPQLLDGQGGILANPQTATAVTLKGAVYNEVDFSIIPRNFGD